MSDKMCPTCGRCEACGSRGQTNMTIFANANGAAPQPTIYMDIPNNAAAPQYQPACSHVVVV